MPICDNITATEHMKEEIFGDAKFEFVQNY